MDQEIPSASQLNWIKGDLSEEHLEKLAEASKGLRNQQLLWLNSEEGREEQEVRRKDMYPTIVDEIGDNKVGMKEGTATSIARTFTEMKALQELNRNQIAALMIKNQRTNEQICSEISDLTKICNTTSGEVQLVGIQMENLSIKQTKDSEKIEEMETMMNEDRRVFGSFMKEQKAIQALLQQEKVIINAFRRASEHDLQLSSASFALHGLPLPKSINDYNKDDFAEVISALKLGLGGDLVDELLAKKGESFINIVSWGPIQVKPDTKGFVYSKNTPACARNGIRFTFKNRGEAGKWERKFRFKLAKSAEERGNGDYCALEVEIYAHLTSVHLHKACLYKGKMICQLFPDFKNYRVVWKMPRGGSRSSLPYLAVEVKASSELIERRHEFFFEGGKPSRQIWAQIEDPTALSQIDNIWFPRFFVRSEEPKTALVNSEPPKTPLVNKDKQKRPRSTPGTTAPLPKKLDTDVANQIHAMSDSEEEGDDGGANKKDVVEVINVGEGEGSKRRWEKAGRRRGRKSPAKDSSQPKLSEVGFFVKKVSDQGLAALPCFGDLA